ncbi:cadherin-like and PC-esterase domain-containing protein 1 isoform X2 [Ornithodoros turicata]|uniref:cadherin-like and PC-esterase domain-containing protein 1 isoform X2 n=1 Tax=Ornithodoros turicata TaxID=34597 RepID=UPI003139D1F9
MLIHFLALASRWRSTKDLFLLLILLTIFLCYFHLGSLIRSTSYKALEERKGSSLAEDIARLLNNTAGEARENLKGTGVLLRVLQAIEEKTLAKKAFDSVVMIGDAADVPDPYVNAFQQLNIKVLQRFEMPQGRNGSNALYVCLSASEDPEHPCYYESSDRNSHRKILGYPSVVHLLGRKNYLCNTMNELRKYTVQFPELGELPLCFVLPDQLQQFRDVSEALAPTTSWIVKPIGDRQSAKPLDYSAPTTARARRQASTFHILHRRAVAQEAVNNPFVVQGRTLSARVFLLLTSLTPLRAFVHRRGLVFHKLASKTLRGIEYFGSPGKTWSLDQLWEYVRRRNGPQDVAAFWTKVERQILGILLVVETEIVSQTFVQNITNNAEVFHRCPSCFQLLSVDFTLSSSLVPYMTHVNVQPVLHPSRSKTANAVKSAILSDMARILTSQTRVSRDVAAALEGSGGNIGLMYHFCRLSHDICLTEEDLRYLLDTRRQFRARGGFQQIYPSIGSEHLTNLLAQLDQRVHQVMFSPSSRTMEYDVSKQHLTPQLHPLLLKIESEYETLDRQREVDPTASTTGGNTQDKDQSMEERHVKYCTHDPSFEPYLQLIEVEPHGRLTPPFHPNITEYHVTVPFDQISVRILAQAAHCKAQARFQHQQEPSKAASFALGMGNNQVTIVVEDLLPNANARVANAYSVNIFRESLTKDEEAFEPESRHVVCNLKQSCELKIYSKESCDLHTDPTTTSDWEKIVEDYEHLPLCPSGAAQGRWLLPCGDCAVPQSCFWNEARWMPYRCRHLSISTPALRQCLKNRKLLFVGDSTNRGIMYYTVRRLNGTLTQWEQSHGHLDMRNINGGTTAVGFAYYPRFWMSPDKMPSLVDTLRQLVERMKPVSNDANTVIVIGGTKWLKLKQLTSVAATLRSLGMKNTRVVIKSYGSGFHQQTMEFNKLSLESQQALAKANSAIIAKALQLGFDVVETFNMTTARFKEFLQGNCACHYHKAVSESLSTYRIEGPINEVYSEILLGRICKEYANRQ